MSMNRRRFIKTALGATTCLTPWSSAWVFAFGDSSTFRIGRLDVEGCNCDPRPGATNKMLLEVEKRTSILVEPHCPVVSAEDESLFESPLVLWAGDRRFDPLSETARNNLAVFLRAGGTLLIDSSEGDTEGEFYRDVTRELDEILPGIPLSRIDSDHVLYKSFYLIDDPPGRVMTAPYMEACEQDQRLMVIFSHNDLLGAWARDNFGNWVYEVYPSGERQREMAFRMGINLSMYVLCLDYKEDQVHVPFILHRREWRVD